VARNYAVDESRTQVSPAERGNWARRLVRQLDPFNVRSNTIEPEVKPNAMNPANGNVDAMLASPEVKRMTTDDMVYLFQEDYETPADKKKVAEALKKKAISARKAGTLTQAEVDNIKKVLPDFNITARDIKKK
jgi:hypothetical protein